MKKIRKKLNDREIVVLTLIIVVVLITIILVGATWYGGKYSTVNLSGGEEYKEYKYHYMLIGQARDEEFWDDIYKGAKNAGIKKEIYVEDLRKNLEQEYSTTDMMTMAIAAKVDGIIVEGDESKELDEMINKASEANIPVITILEDNPQSKRKSFVGINDYKLGEMYGSQIMNLARNTKTNVVVLMEDAGDNSNPNLVYSGIKERTSNDNITITPITINHQDFFNSEEIIRSIVLGKEQPDIIVCLTAVDTICAYQVVVDYNAVGAINIIGYYYSEDILSAINKDIIQSSISVETKEIGKKALETLFTYKKDKHVTEYVQVESQLITKDNVSDFIKSEGK
ncbi:MAG: substrate-binding domain-containing protein [Lachnospiraceae bacterium]|nr:substrate-binding domain-containing protein [Lachnospiraceae bacterium]